jgi:ribosomal subunit interface protein
MTIQVTGKNIHAGDAYQVYVADKIRAVLQKYIARDVGGHVRLEKERGLFKTNCSVKLASGLLLEAHGEGPDAYASADDALERFEKRVRRYKGRLKSHTAARTGSSQRKGNIEARDYVVSVGDDDTEEHVKDHPLIIAETERRIDELSVGEAVMQLDLTEAQFMIFRNAAHAGLNVVYRRPDGHIGWIDAEPKPTTGANGALKST